MPNAARLPTLYLSLVRFWEGKAWKYDALGEIESSMDDRYQLPDVPGIIIDHQIGHGLVYNGTACMYFLFGNIAKFIKKSFEQQGNVFFSVFQIREMQPSA